MLSSSSQVSRCDPIEIIRAICRAVQQAKERLGDLDAALGDGDHGISMAKSFRAVEEQLPMMAGKDLGVVLYGVSTTLFTTAGGAMAPLFGTAFREASSVAAQMDITDGQTVTGSLIATMIAAARDGVARVGGAHVGDKTMLDALDPAAAAAAWVAGTSGSAAATLAAAAAAAEAGASATTDLVATVGRASRLGERSKGHPDPGATSVAIILRAAADHLIGEAAS